jgi:methionine synthase II (cobalamin-independent)
MIARWIRETRLEYERAKLNQNAFKMIQMSELEDALKEMRDRLS